MSTDILNTEVGQSDDGRRNLVVKSANIEEITFDDGRTANKVFLTCETLNGEREFQISQAWNETRKGEKKVQGLWVQLDDNGKLVPSSTLGKLLEFHTVDKVNDLIDQKILGYPCPKGYIVLTTYEIEEDNTPILNKQS